MTAADLVIAELARREAELLERVSVLDADARAFREIALAAIHQLHDVGANLDRLRAQHHRLIADFRAMRAQLSQVAA